MIGILICLPPNSQGYLEDNTGGAAGGYFQLNPIKFFYRGKPPDAVKDCFQILFFKKFCSCFSDVSHQLVKPARCRAADKRVPRSELLRLQPEFKLGLNEMQKADLRGPHKFVNAAWLFKRFNNWESNRTPQSDQINCEPSSRLARQFFCTDLYKKKKRKELDQT